MKYLLTVFFLSLFFQSCVITTTPGFYSGYSNLTESQKANVVFLPPDSDISDSILGELLYAVNGVQLREFISKKKDVMVYIYSPHCTSERCYSLRLVENYCHDNDLIFIVVIEYYDFDKMSIDVLSKPSFPVFSVNEKYYKTKYCNKYMKLFIKDLLEYQHYTKDDMFSNMFIFESGKLVRTSMKLSF